MGGDWVVRRGLSEMTCKPNSEGQEGHRHKKSRRRCVTEGTVDSNLVPKVRTSLMYQNLETQKFGFQTSSISTTWELGRNAEFQPIWFRPIE